MTLHIELDPDLEALLSDKAQLSGVAPEQAAKAILRENLSAPGSAHPILDRGPWSKRQISDFMAELRSHRVDAPHLDGCTWPRSIIYDGRD